MRTIFLASGPNFKKNQTFAPFRNTNVYSLICRLVGINGLPNNGSLTPFLNILQPNLNNITLPISEYSKPPLLVISLDGFQAAKLDEYMSKNPNSIFNQIHNNGVKAEYMIPSFPTLTFPNHHTLVTGLYIESHGIVGNSFYDPNYDIKVNLIGGTNANEEQWWNQSEPVWLTARNNNLRTGSFFWAG
jgi:hypothetical protein